MQRRILRRLHIVEPPGLVEAGVGELDRTGLINERLAPEPREVIRGKLLPGMEQWQPDVIGEPAQLPLLKNECHPVVVTHYRNLAASADQGDAFLRVPSVTHNVSQGHHAGHTEGVDVRENRFQSREIGMHVGQDRNRSLKRRVGVPSGFFWFSLLGFHREILS